MEDDKAKRRSNGTFGPGNRASPGRPRGSGDAVKIARLRSVLLDATSEETMLHVWAALLIKAKEGNIAAIREVFDRTIGKPVEADLIDRLAALEEHLTKQIETGKFR